MHRPTVVAGLIVLLTASGSGIAIPAVGNAAGENAAQSLPRPHDPAPQEKHLGPLLMLTDGAENAEAYFSYDGQQLVFQSNRPPYDCDQIYTFGITGGEPQLVSTLSRRDQLRLAAIGLDPLPSRPLAASRNWSRRERVARLAPTSPRTTGTSFMPRPTWPAPAVRHQRI